MKIELEIEDEFFTKKIPGYEIVRVGKPEIGETVLSFWDIVEYTSKHQLHSDYYVILKKIKPRRRIFECISEIERKATKGEFCEGSLYPSANESIFYNPDPETIGKYKIFKEVFKNDNES